MYFSEKGATILKVKVYTILVLLLVCSVLLAGCGKKAVTVDPSQNYLTAIDDTGAAVTLKKKPERVVALSPSFFGLIDAVGGKLVGRASSNVAEIPEAMKAVPELGFNYNIDAERLVALKPDCVIALNGRHNDLAKLLAANNIPVFLIDVKTYQEVQDKLALFGRIFGTEDKACQASENLLGQMNAVADKTPRLPKKVAILHATAKSVTVELENSIAGNVAEFLGLKNVAVGQTPLSGNPDKTPYSLEELVKQQPEIIFITSMGRGEGTDKRFATDVSGNPAWGSLQAVKEKQVYVLPENLFLVNPGMNYPKAVQYMAKFVYPEVFANE